MGGAFGIQGYQKSPMHPPFQRELMLILHGLVADDSPELMQQLGLGQQKLGQHAGTLVGLNLCGWVAHDFLLQNTPCALTSCSRI